ncbi:putative sporulation protein YyaC [Anaerosolibacter carboniphilus]|uniref:Putative sporulation protein YyaC n=1 Tax=Anaerosolibacter carboniphilus TaxID=1417629 RepID=A0A841L0E4_9FIRM|nr:spore protease YyaC [Anaerosolibacter carboniphilus]MBB6219013.1 putative sporulation protein YyaC [Anaerosolibacter carboniphilus]
MSTHENALYGIKRNLISTKEKNCVKKIGEALYRQITEHKKVYEKIIILCIGTDRCTGDSLGPLVGMMLSKRKAIKGKIQIMGTLNDPVHAKNLHEAVAKIDQENTLVIAVDAMLSKAENLGKVIITNSSLIPGAGIDRTDLQAVGHISITASVNISGPMSSMMLMDTRLSFVFKIAEVLDKAITQAIKEISLENTSTSKSYEKKLRKVE